MPPVQIHGRQSSRITIYNFKYIILVAFCLVGYTTTEAAISITASHHDIPGATTRFYTGLSLGYDNGILYDNRRAQSFTTIMSGYLDSISLTGKSFYSYEEDRCDLRITVTEMSDNQPGIQLVSKVFSSDDMPPASNDSWDINVSFDFSDSGLYLASDTQYAFILSTDEFGGNRYGGDYRGYDGGTLMRFQNSGPFVESEGDLFFEVHVNSVPEPAVLGMLILGSLGVVKRRKVR